MKSFIKLMLSFLFISSAVFAQNGTRMVDFNAKSLGRGGTSIGNFDTPGLMMTNPAGISFLENSMLDANLSLMLPSLHFKNNLNDTEGDDNVFPLPSLAYVNKYDESKFSWGLGFFTYGGMGADFTLDHALFRNQDGSFNQQEYHSQLASFQGGLSAAYKFNEMISAGVSLHLVYSTLEFWMPYSLNPSIMQGTAMPGMTFGQIFSAPPSMGGFGYDEVTASAEMSGLTGLGFNGKIGFAFKFNEKLTLGLSYTSPTNMTFKNGSASMDMTAQLNDAFGKAIQGYMMQNPGASQQEAQQAIMQQFGGMGVDLQQGVKAEYDLETKLNFPQSIGFGLAYKASDNFSLSFDLEWLNWEAAFDEMKLALSNGNNSNINTMLGNEGNFEMTFPLNWENSIIAKIGGEFMASEALTLRLGYAYGSNPVPESTIFPVFPAIVENHIMLGGSYQFTNSFAAHLAYEMVMNNELTAENESLIANEYNASTSELATNLFHIAFTYNF